MYVCICTFLTDVLYTYICVVKIKVYILALLLNISAKYALLKVRGMHGLL